MASKAPAQAQSQGLPPPQSQQVRREKEKGKALVKAVNSGDSIILLITTNSVPVEKEVTLSHISAPRLARREGKDEVSFCESSILCKRSLTKDS